MKELYRKYIGNKANMIMLLVLIGIVSLWIGFHVFVAKNDPMHFVVVEGVPSGKMDAKKEPGHFFKWLDRLSYWEWSNSVWFSEFDGEGGSSDDAIKDLQFADGAVGSVSGIMVYAFEDTVPKSYLIEHQSVFRTQDNFEDRMIRINNKSNLNITASMMSSEESYTTRKKEFGLIALDQLYNGKYQTRVGRDTIIDFTGDRVVTDVTKVIYGPDKKPLRTKEKCLSGMYVYVPILSLYELQFERKADSTIQRKCAATMGKIVSSAKTKLEKRKNYLASISGQVDTLTQKYEQEKLNMVAVIAAQRNRDSIRIESETGKEVARIRNVIAGMKKQMGELNGKKEIRVRQLMVSADKQLYPRIESYVRMRTAQAEAFASAKSIMPEIIVSGSGANGAWDMLNYQTGKNMLGTMPSADQENRKK